MAAVGMAGWLGAETAAADAEKGRALAVNGMAFTLLLLNLVDALCTITWVELRIAWEANPVMAFALSGSPVIFMVAKMALVQLGTWLLVSHQHTRAARVALAFGCALYVGIAAWHAAFFARVFLG